MTDNNRRETLAALCKSWQQLMDKTRPLPGGRKHGPTEFWRQVRFLQSADAELDNETAAEEVLADSRAGGCNCPKCKGTGRFVVVTEEGPEDRGPCFMCKGKGYCNAEDNARNYGYRSHQPGRQERYLPGGSAQ